MTPDDNAFDDRKKSQEAKYKMDEERRFKVRARRNKLFGLWVAETLGLTGETGQDFSRDVAMIGLEARTDPDFLAGVRARISETDGTLDESRLGTELLRLEEVARNQIAQEFPAALDGDHAPVGDSPHFRK